MSDAARRSRTENRRLTTGFSIVEASGGPCSKGFNDMTVRVVTKN